MTGQLPVFQDFYRTYLRGGKKHTAVSGLDSWGNNCLAKGMVRSYGEVSAHTRASFYWAFGVTPDEQVVLEEFYRGVDLGDICCSEMSYQVPMPL